MSEKLNQSNCEKMSKNQEILEELAIINETRFRVGINSFEDIMEYYNKGTGIYAERIKERNEILEPNLEKIRNFTHASPDVFIHLSGKEWKDVHQMKKDGLLPEDFEIIWASNEGVSYVEKYNKEMYMELTIRPVLGFLDKDMNLVDFLSYETESVALSDHKGAAYVCSFNLDCADYYDVVYVDDEKGETKATNGDLIETKYSARGVYIYPVKANK